MQARLLLEDGTLFTGKAFGSKTEQFGEVVFHTGMTGYQEMITNPANFGQLVTMTYPLIGNYGINRDDFESIRPYIHGLIVREYEPVPSNWRADTSLEQLLEEFDVPGIARIDTRMLTRLLRQKGTMKGVITTSTVSESALLERLKEWESPRDMSVRAAAPSTYMIPGTKQKVVVVDFGVTQSLLRGFVRRGCEVVIVPGNSSAADVLKHNPDGVVLSGGPGNPKDAAYASDLIRSLIGKLPLCGTGLGHQLFALACGADTVKLKFGHRGRNQPVKELATGRCLMTLQNHGYVVDDQSLTGTPLVVTHISHHDQTIEGLKHETAPAFTVQFDPADAEEMEQDNHFFAPFVKMMEQYEQNPPRAPRQMQFAKAWEGGQTNAP